MNKGCGICGIYPKWLRNRATPKNFIAVYGLLGTVQAMAFIYIVVTLTTLEKRFKIPSRTTGKSYSRKSYIVKLHNKTIVFHLTIIIEVHIYGYKNLTRNDYNFHWRLISLGTRARDAKQLFGKNSEKTRMRVKNYSQITRN